MILIRLLTVFLVAALFSGNKGLKAQNTDNCSRQRMEEIVEDYTRNLGFSEPIFDTTYILWWDTIRVFRSGVFHSIHWRNAYTAVNCKGDVFRLSGYDSTDFHDLLLSSFRDTIGIDMVKRIYLLYYLYNVTSNKDCEVQLIDSSNIEKYKKGFPFIVPPIVERNFNNIFEEEYLVRYYVVVKKPVVELYLQSFWIDSRLEYKFQSIEIPLE